MRSRLCVLVAIAFVLAASSCARRKALDETTTSGSQNEQPDFRGHKWGMAPPEAWGQPVATSLPRSITFYEAPGEDLTLGCAKLDLVVYGFWQGKLEDVIVGFGGDSNYTCVLNALKEKRGDGDQSNVKSDEFPEKHLWNGVVTGILLEYNKVKEKGQLNLFSVAIENEEKAWKKVRKEPLHNAVIGLEALASATTAGVTYQNYMERKINARIPVDAYLNEYGQDAPQAVALRSALTAYDAAGTVWAFCIEFSYPYIPKTIEITPGFALPHPQLRPVFEQFPGLMTLSDENTIPRSAALSYLWQQADQAIATARKGID